MTSPALKIIHDEHQALSAMLTSLIMMAKRTNAQTTAEDFEVMRAMLFYITEYPEKLHHRKESETLFPMIKAKSSKIDQVIEELDEQHHQGEARVYELMNLLIAWEMMGESRQKVFLNAIQEYTEFYIDHMRKEVTIVIPLAQEILSDEDWATMNAAFEENKDPLTGHSPSKEYERLFKHVLSNAPQPIGLGRAQ